MKRFSPWFFISVGIIFLTRAPSLFEEIFDTDEGIFAICARALLQGELLYVDIIDHKPPFIYYLYAAGLSIVNDLRWIHLLTTVWIVFTALVLKKLVERWSDAHAGWMAALLYALFVSNIHLASSAEVLMDLPVVLAALFFSSSSFFLAGFFVAAASLIKHQAGAILVAWILFVVVNTFRKKNAFPWQSIIMVLVGLLVPYALFSVPFFLQGNFNDAVEWGYLENFFYLNPPIPSHAGQSALKAFVVAIVLSSLYLWVRGIFSLRSIKENDGVLFGGLWFMISLFAVVAGGRFYTHYFIQLIAPLCFLVAPYLKDDWKRWRWRLLIITPALGMFLYNGSRVGTHAYHAWKPEVKELTHFLQEQSNSNDSIFVWGNYSPILTLADRPSGTRFTHATLALGNVDPCHVPEGFAVQKLAHETFYPQMLEDLGTRQPKFIVDTAPANAHCWGRFPLSAFPELQKIIDAHYDFRTIIGHFQVYQKIPGT